MSLGLFFQVKHSFGLVFNHGRSFAEVRIKERVLNLVDIGSCVINLFRHVVRRRRGVMQSWCYEKVRFLKVDLCQLNLMKPGLTLRDQDLRLESGR